VSTHDQPITIHQFHYSTSAGDAVTNHMLLIRAALREFGVQGDIFTVENKAPQSYAIQKWMPAKLWNSDLVIIHHSHGNPVLEPLLRHETPKALIYHNVTPSSFFTHDRHLARFSDLGRRQLGAFVGRVVQAFGVSRYNMADLEMAGLRNVQLFPLLDLSAPWKGVNSNQHSAPSTNQQQELLFVGKQTPHKNQALLIKALYYLNTIAPNQYRLVLAGRSDRVYGEYLRLLSKVLGLSHCVEFTGPISQNQLESRYARASAFVCASLHEGFCVPLVEAMQRQVPILSLNVSGIRETLGKAGVRFAANSPLKMAHTIHAVLNDAPAVEAVLKSQDERLAELAKWHNKKRMQDLLLRVVRDLRGTPHSVASLPDVYV
jgi:glycosyltransferase involved in cell wall biosynthesis